MTVWEPLEPKVTDLDKNENSHLFFSVLRSDSTGAVSYVLYTFIMLAKIIMHLEFDIFDFDTGLIL